MKNFSKDILGKIKKEEIKPIPKWNFVFKTSFVWTAFGVSVVLGGFAFGSILAQINATEWDVHPHVTDSLWYFVFLALPYVWIVFLIGFSALAYYYLRHTSKGYRYNAVIVVNSSVLISVLLGSALFATGISHRMEEKFEERLPFYHGIMDPRMKIWMSPEKGLLAGKIIKIENEEEIKLIDFKKNVWTVDISEATWKRNEFVQENIRVKVIGTKNGEFLFIAKEVRPWREIMREMKEMCDQHNPEMPCHMAPKFFEKKVKEN